MGLEQEPLYSYSLSRKTLAVTIVYVGLIVAVIFGQGLASGILSLTDPIGDMIFLAISIAIIIVPIIGLLRFKKVEFYDSYVKLYKGTIHKTIFDKQYSELEFSWKALGNGRTVCQISITGEDTKPWRVLDSNSKRLNKTLFMWLQSKVSPDGQKEKFEFKTFGTAP